MFIVVVNFRYLALGILFVRDTLVPSLNCLKMHVGIMATLLEWWLHYWNGGYTIEKVATLLE